MFQSSGSRRRERASEFALEVEGAEKTHFLKLIILCDCFSLSKIFMLVYVLDDADNIQSESCTSSSVSHSPFQDQTYMRATDVNRLVRISFAPS